MPSKKQREKSEHTKGTGQVVRALLTFGMPKDEYLDKARKEHPENVQLLSDEYESHREILALEPDNLEYFNSVQELMNATKQAYYDVYMPVVNIQQIYTYRDVAVMTVKALGNFNLFIGGEEQEFKKGLKYVLPVQGMFQSIPYVIGNRETKQILTKQTQFEKIEKEKIVEKTKVITQKKKSGIDKKKLNKAIMKTKHEMTKKWMPNVVDDILANFAKNLN
jgi:hypothetical protein